MIKIPIYIALMSLTVSTLVAQSTEPPPAQRPGKIVERQWQVTNVAAVSGTFTPAGIQPGVAYELHNSRRMEMGLSSQIDYRYNFVRNGSSYMFLRPNEGNVRDHRALRPDEDVALCHVESGRFMKPPVVLDPRPSYVWQLHHLQGANFALYNTTKKQYLLFITDGDQPNTKAGFEKKPKPKPTPFVWEGKPGMR